MAAAPQSALLWTCLFLALAAIASGDCHNRCNGHGSCSQQDCTCYEGWQGAACEERVCPYGPAWTEYAVSDRVYAYAECSERGVCNRATGVCYCFEHYTGEACRRTVCPNDCSNRGWCEITGTSRVPTCTCDYHYFGPDCSKKYCPKGTNFKVPTYTYQKQKVSITSTWADMTGYFVLKYTDARGATWKTRPIAFSRYDDLTTSTLMKANEEYVANSLLSLPNNVVSAVEVRAASDTNGIAYVVEMKGSEGALALMECDASYCNFPGCSPRSSGLYSYGTVSCTVTEDTATDKTLEECSGNGLCDYETGLCDCFAGATGEGCEILDSLI